MADPCSVELLGNSVDAGEAEKETLLAESAEAHVGHVEAGGEPVAGEGGSGGGLQGSQRGRTGDTRGRARPEAASAPRVEGG